MPPQLRKPLNSGFFIFKMDFVVYILHSLNYEKTYVGYTSNLIMRFHSHNSISKKGFTVRYRPWRVVYVEFFASKSEAMQRESWLKSGKGREFVKSLLQ